MKTSARYLAPGAALAFFLTLAFAGFAQEPPAPSAAPATDHEKASPAAAPATPAAMPETPATAPAETPKLRRLDVPAAPEESKPLPKPARSHVHHDSGNEVVNIGSDSFLAKDHRADAVVSVFGSATSEGDVSDSVVSIFGNTRATGPVGDAAVAVFGNTYVNGKVGDTVVAVFGNVELGPDAEIAGDVVAVGGRVTQDPKAVIHGQVHNVAFGHGFADWEWLHSWIENCAFYGRLLAFAPHLMWAWWIALGFLIFYVLLALLFGKGIEKCTETLEQRPGYSILAALLTVLLAPVVTILLIFTGVGIAVVPFLMAALFFAGLFGKAVMLGWLGRRIARFMGFSHPALAVLVGGVILLFLYTVPVLSVVLYKLLGWIGLGVVVYTLLLGMKREKPAVPPAVLPAPGAPVAPASEAAVDSAAVPASPEPAPVMMAPAAGAPPLLSAATLPRAGFWIRMAALLLDVILVGIICNFLSGVFPNSSHAHIHADLLPALAIYGAVMWKLKGTTVGGIVCGLKVVRLDERPLDWGTTVVRALGCFLSLVVLGLGFLWVVFDDQRQSWHDKIAGTTVVHVPKGVSLV
jgi:uncharacterized RDD family membrane protein YckC/putative Mn2+ efflux pump MntP